jgi:hypothetical protein
MVNNEIYFMKTRFSLSGSVRKTVNVKTFFGAGFIVGAFLAETNSSQASLFVGNVNVILNDNGGGNSFYAVDSYNSPTFNGTLGGLTIQAGQSLLLGGQLQTYPGGGNYYGAASALIHYSISGTSISGQLNLPWAYNLGGGGGNDVWEQSSSGSEINLDQSLSAGTYTLNVWFSAVENDNSATITDGTSGSPYSASFTVTAVPEPITLALPIFGGLVLVAGLTRRLVSKQPALPA